MSDPVPPEIFAEPWPWTKLTSTSVSPTECLGVTEPLLTATFPLKNQKPMKASPLLLMRSALK